VDEKLTAFVNRRFEQRQSFMYNSCPNLVSSALLFPTLSPQSCAAKYLCLKLTSDMSLNIAQMPLVDCNWCHTLPTPSQQPNKADR
jgi:hypothetical protein